MMAGSMPRLTELLRTFSQPYTRLRLRVKQEKKILIHMGLDTVDLKGEPFSIRVSEGQKVKSETLLAVIDLTKLEKAQKDDMIIVVFPEMIHGNLLMKNQNVTIQDEVFKF
jgi:PTS system glucose-specific IIC component